MKSIAGERGWWSWLLDLVYPGVCRLCGESVKGGGCLCGECAKGLPSLEEPFCEVCGEPSEGAIESVFQCPNCRGHQFAFAFARPALVNSPAVLDLVHELKYSRRIELARELGLLAGRAFEDPRLSEALEGGWPLVPVPLHARRKRWRHFNQAEEIARVLGDRTGLAMVAALRRVRATTTQTRLNRKARRKNLKGAFEVVGSFRPGPGAVLVDDVLTTGSTVDECARTLRKAGVQKVVVVTVMRG